MLRTKVVGSYEMERALERHTIRVSASSITTASWSKHLAGADSVRPNFMAPGRTIVIKDMGAAELDELEDEDIDDPDSLSVPDPDKAR